MNPFQDKTILITRAKHQSDEWVARLTECGARVISIPLIEIVPPSDDYRSLDAAINDVDRYDGVLFTSTNAVRAFFERCEVVYGSGSGSVIPSEAKPSRGIPCFRILKARDSSTFPPFLQKGGIGRNDKSTITAAVGSATARCLEEYGIRDIVVASEPTSQGLLEAMSCHEVKGKTFLQPRAREGRDDLAIGLRNRGAEVDVVEAYRTVMPPDVDRERLIDLIENREVDVVLFASPSAVDNFVAIVGCERIKDFSESRSIVPIGPATARAVECYGVSLDDESHDVFLRAIGV